jgi:hypothetical protein
VARALSDQAERLAIDAQQVIGDAEVALRGEELSGLHPHLGAEPSLALTHQRAPDLHLPLRDTDAALLPPVQVERHRHPDRQVVVGAQRLLASEVEHGVGPQAGLPEPALGRLHVETHRPHVRVVGEGARHQLVDRDLVLRGERRRVPADIARTTAQATRLAPPRPACMAPSSAHRHGELRRALAGGPVPAHRHLPRPESGNWIVPR